MKIGLKMNGKCAKNRKRLGELLSGELSVGEEAGLRRHVEGCPACGRELERLRKLSDIVALSKRESPPPDYWERLRDSVMRRVRRGDRVRRPLSSVLRIPVTAAAVAAGIFAMVRITRPPAPESPPAERPGVTALAAPNTAHMYPLARLRFPAEGERRYMDAPPPPDRGMISYPLVRFPEDPDEHGPLALLSPPGEGEAYW